MIDLLRQPTLSGDRCFYNTCFINLRRYSTLTINPIPLSLVYHTTYPPKDLDMLAPLDELILEEGTTIDPAWEGWHA